MSSGLDRTGNVFTVNSSNTDSILRKQFVGCATALIPFMNDMEVTDILINGTHSLYLEKEGELVAQASPFDTVGSLFDFIERLLVPVGKGSGDSLPDQLVFISVASFAG